MLIDGRLIQVTQEQTYPLMFATLSGTHLYGFPSSDSDYDLRGAHILPLTEIVGLHPPNESIEVYKTVDELYLDLVTHEVRKYILMLLKQNGTILEQIFSPLVVHTSPEHEELKAIAQGCITRQHAQHYLGLARSQWKQFNQQNPRQVKPLLYVYRALLAGINLMRTGSVEANLDALNLSFRLDYLPNLILRKVEGAERAVLAGADIAFHEREYERLYKTLEQAGEASSLPDKVSDETQSALNDLLVRVRLSGWGFP
jgi:predicted nucleotidyltransferase